MSVDTLADRAARTARPVPDGMVLRVEGFEGPLDLLLELARDQKVDLAQISVGELVDQFLVALEALGRDRRLRLEKAADWLVMAAWLIWLKSRLLLPQGSAEAREAERSAQVLTDRLEELRQVRALAAWLAARPQLGREVWARGAPGKLTADVVSAELPELLRACLLGLDPGRQTFAAVAAWRPGPPPLWTAPQALARMREMLAATPGGASLLAFLPRLRADLPLPTLRRRAAISSTLVAALELAREAQVVLHQDGAFADITVVPVAPAILVPVASSPSPAPSPA